jgi:hypothetical protein
MQNTHIWMVVATIRLELAPAPIGGSGSLGGGQDRPLSVTSAPGAPDDGRESANGQHDRLLGLIPMIVRTHPAGKNARSVHRADPRSVLRGPGLALQFGSAVVERGAGARVRPAESEPQEQQYQRHGETADAVDQECGQAVYAAD